LYYDRSTNVNMALRKGLTNFILLALEKSVDGYVRFEDFAYHHYLYQYGIPSLKKSALSRAFKRLRNNGFIELVDENKLIYRLTDEGKEEAVWASLRVEEKEWDGRWRLVIFDIPEKRRIARDLLRQKLKAFGFIKWQKSVWASKKNCTKPLRDYIKKVGITDWVMVLESDNV